MKKTRELKQLEFINSFKKDILTLGVENKDIVGYVQLYADKDFKPYGIRFIEAEFKELEFKELELKQLPGNPVCYVYFKILWQDNHTTWSVKELVLGQIVLPENKGKLLD